jgi:hypothetical protein
MGESFHRLSRFRQLVRGQLLKTQVFHRSYAKMMLEAAAKVGYRTETQIGGHLLASLTPAQTVDGLREGHDLDPTFRLAPEPRQKEPFQSPHRDTNLGRQSVASVASPARLLCPMVDRVQAAVHLAPASFHSALSP